MEKPDDPVFTYLMEIEVKAPTMQDAQRIVRTIEPDLADRYRDGTIKFVLLPGVAKAR